MAAPGESARSSIPTEDAKINAGAKPPTSKLAGYLPREVRVQASEYAAKTDEILIRLQRLFSTSANIETFLTTLNYALYLLVYSQKGLPTRSYTSATALNDFVSAARNSLRLLQLPVLYTLLRTLLSQDASSRGDTVVWRIQVVQSILNILYQVLENVAHLIELNVLSSRSVPFALYGNQSTLWLHSNRFWLAGITCDLLRLAREAVLERRRVNRNGKQKVRTREEQEGIDKQWWDELTMAGCTWPLVLHWSLENGLGMVNDGVIGAMGLAASWGSLRQRWQETKNGWL